MVVRVVALVTFNEDAATDLARYFAVTGPLLERAGAKIISQFEMSEHVVGEVPAQSVLVVEYPNRAAVDAVFSSEEYASIIPYRDRAFLTYNVSIVSNESEFA